VAAAKRSDGPSFWIALHIGHLIQRQEQFLGDDLRQRRAHASAEFDLAGVDRHQRVVAAADLDPRVHAQAAAGRRCRGGHAVERDREVEAHRQAAARSEKSAPGNLCRAHFSAP
jgi:hypothetical protein